MLGQVHTPFVYHQVSRNPSPVSVASATSDSPVNSGIYQMMLSEEQC